MFGLQNTKLKSRNRLIQYIIIMHLETADGELIVLCSGDEDDKIIENLYLDDDLNMHASQKGNFYYSSKYL